MAHLRWLWRGRGWKSRRHGHPHRRRWNHLRHLLKEGHHHRADPLAATAVCVSSRRTFGLEHRRCLHDRSILRRPEADLDPEDLETDQQRCALPHQSVRTQQQACQEYPLLLVEETHY